MFGMDGLQGYAHDVEAEVGSEFAYEREARILKVVQAAVNEVVREIGGYVSVSVHGHFNEHEGQVGDNLNVQISSLLVPPAPVQDAGLEAAGGSPRLFPPEASTAAPATEDNSPPAAQEPIPQSADAVPPPAEPEATTTKPEPTPSDFDTGASESGPTSESVQPESSSGLLPEESGPESDESASSAE